MQRCSFKPKMFLLSISINQQQICQHCEASTVHINLDRIPLWRGCTCASEVRQDELCSICSCGHFKFEKTCSIVWEQELYNQFKYHEIKRYFHTFEAEDGQAGLNFASEEEASLFKEQVNKKLKAKQRRREEKKRGPSHHGGNVELKVRPSPSMDSVNSLSGSAIPTDEKSSSTGKKKKDKDKKGRKGRLTKDDFGLPSNFQHVSHVGFDPDKGFDMTKLQLDGNWRKLFDKIGVNTKELEKDQETAKFIYDYVEQHGGIEKAVEEMQLGLVKSQPPPPTPSREDEDEDDSDEDDDDSEWED